MVIQQITRKLLMIDILMSETCWAHKKWNKIASDINLVFYSSTILRRCVHNNWKKRSYVFKYYRSSARLAHSRAAASVESKMATMEHKTFCVREFIKTESVTAVHRAFRLRFNIQPPTRKSICRWNRQFEQIGCLCKDKSSDRPRVSEENVRRIQESFERSPRKSTCRASRELGYRNQQSGVCWGAVYCSIGSILLNHPVYFTRTWWRDLYIRVLLRNMKLEITLHIKARM